jgi:micrococcal nuclease
MRTLLTLLSLITLATAQPQEGDTILGKCVSVTDADTISLLVDKSVYKIRLSGIDAPERGQEYGTKATQALASKVKGKQLTVEVAGYDRYRRMLGKLMLDGESIEFWLLRNGWAWQYVKYDQSEELRLAQQQAKQDGVGLWAGEANGVKPMPPWEYRDRKRTLSKIKSERKASSTPASDATGSFWLNTGSGSRHNEGCRYYRNTKRGKLCGANEGRACGICGG